MLLKKKGLLQISLQEKTNFLGGISKVDLVCLKSSFFKTEKFRTKLIKAAKIFTDEVGVMASPKGMHAMDKSNMSSNTEMVYGNDSATYNLFCNRGNANLYSNCINEVLLGDSLPTVSYDGGWKEPEKVSGEVLTFITRIKDDEYAKSFVGNLSSVYGFYANEDLGLIRSLKRCAVGLEGLLGVEEKKCKEGRTPQGPSFNSVYERDVGQQATNGKIRTLTGQRFKPYLQSGGNFIVDSVLKISECSGDVEAVKKKLQGLKVPFIQQKFKSGEEFLIVTHVNDGEKVGKRVHDAVSRMPKTEVLGNKRLGLEASRGAFELASL